MRSVYLVMVTGEGNHNKFYRMTQINDQSFEVRYGRIGAKESPPKIYSLDRWTSIYNSKIKKGYVDESDSHLVKKKSKYSEIKDPIIRSFFNEVEGYSSRALKANYTISYTDVTSAMVREAQFYLSQIGPYTDIETANDNLIKAFHALPRRMKKVSDYLIQEKSDIPKVLTREWELLDIMKARIDDGGTDSAIASKNQTILEHLGLSIELVNEQTEKQIKKFMTPESSDKFHRAFRVRNKATDDRFYKFMKDNGYTEDDNHYLYHGSRNQNWYGLMTNGPLLAPDGVITNGKAFGNGIYFANRARKSIGYSSLKGSYWTKGTSQKGYLAVYKVLYRNPKYVQLSGQYSLRTISPCDAVFAEKGTYLKNDEIIIFREEQATLQYIIEIA